MHERRVYWKRPEVLLPFTFLAAILIGTAVLSLPGMHTGKVGLLEAFFTATSSVCVTGLGVVDTGTAFHLQGQVAIVALIQVGGLGIMTFSMLALALAGRRVTLVNEAALREGFTPLHTWRIGRLVGTVVGLTFFIEGLGFLALWQQMGDPWEACFHSVSAFCNAGFSTRAASLTGCSPWVLATIAALILLGGIGFTTILEIVRKLLPGRSHQRRFSLHARVAIFTSVLLIFAGAALIAATDPAKWRHALFLSISARTAGFESTPVGELSGGTLLVLLFLMFVGASPGSTGGGIKTCTFAVGVLLVASILRGRDKVVVQGREIPRDLLRRMFAVVSCALVVVMVGTLLVDVCEGGDKSHFLALLFEVVSAFGTVGLSTGITPELTASSKLVLCAIMFIGRVGSMSFFLLLIRDTASSHVRYPEERLMIG